jgi:hypothetical protein
VDIRISMLVEQHPNYYLCKELQDLQDVLDSPSYVSYLSNLWCHLLSFELPQSKFYHLLVKSMECRRLFSKLSRTRILYWNIQGRIPNQGLHQLRIAKTLRPHRQPSISPRSCEGPKHAKFSLYPVQSRIQLKLMGLSISLILQSN